MVVGLAVKRHGISHSTCDGGVHTMAPSNMAAGRSATDEDNDNSNVFFCVSRVLVVCVCACVPTRLEYDNKEEQRSYIIVVRMHVYRQS